MTEMSRKAGQEKLKRHDKSYVIKIRESIDILVILHFYEKSTSNFQPTRSYCYFNNTLKMEPILTYYEINWFWESLYPNCLNHVI